MKGYLITAASLLLFSIASFVSAGDESAKPDPGYVPDPYLADPYGLEPPAYGYQAPHAHPMFRRPYPYAPPGRIHVEKAMYEDGYLLRVYTQGLAPEDIEVVADRGRLRLRSERSRQREWQSEQPYWRSSTSSRSSVRRSIRLPYDADGGKLTTSVEEGVLVIRIPRMQ
jgi:HSP20 family molecular chaperone IbpA